MNNHTSLDERGNQLRLDLQELYSSMRRNKTLRAGINDIGDFIRGYIPEGISFEDAEHILRSAGSTNMMSSRRCCFRVDLCRGPSSCSDCVRNPRAITAP